MDPQAINYNPLATEDCGGPYGGVLPVPHPQDFSCCTYPTEGCTDPNATNYNPNANVGCSSNFSGYSNFNQQGFGGYEDRLWFN